MLGTYRQDKYYFSATSGGDMDKRLEEVSMCMGKVCLG